MQNSNALVLEILRLDNGLKMSLLETKDPAPALRRYTLSLVSFSEIESLCNEVVFVLNKTERTINSSQESFRSLQKSGQLLWDFLFTKQIKEALKRSQVKDLILSIDEELIPIPWELLFDGDNFLCLKFNLGRSVRTKEMSAPLEYRGLNGILRMLILADPTSDLKSAYLEGINIRNRFDHKRESVRIDFKSSCIDKLYVKKNICDYDIVHFAGHCEFSGQSQQDCGWVLNDGKFSIPDILGIGQTLPSPLLIFSNACHSAYGLIDTDYQTKNYNLAQAFLMSGVRHYLGTIRKIEDSVSLDFSNEFYAQLVSGNSVGESVRLGRIKLIKDYGISSICWANYLLYGDPNFALFEKRKKEPSFISKWDFAKYKKYIVWFSIAVAGSLLAVFLYTRLPSINPGTYVKFLAAKKSFQYGHNQETILLCNRIIEKDPLFLGTYPLLADTYLRSGDREKALKIYFDYMLYSEKRGDKKDLSSSYIGIGWVYQLGAQYQKAFDFYNKAIDLSRQNNDRLNEAVALRKLAVWYIDKKDYNAALGLLTKSSEINRENQNRFEYRYNLACDYFDIGLVFTNKDDFATAKEFYNKSLFLFEKLKLKNELSDIYFNLGEIYLLEKQYQKALACYMKGLKIDESENNRMNLTSDYNMIAELYMDMDNLKDAEVYFNRSVSVSLQINALPELAQAYSNLGLLYKKKGSKNKARENFRFAQEIYARIDQDNYQEMKKELLSLNTD